MGRLVVVTGAGSGIGRATADAFAALGAKVIYADLDPAAAAAAAGRTGVPYEVDVADVASLTRFSQWVRAEHGVPDVVVNNAGIAMIGPFLGHTEQDWRRIVGVNLLGAVDGCRLFGAQMVERGKGGHLVNVTSVAGYTPSRMLSAYASTKAAVLMFSQCLRADLADHGIGVSAICPGLISTGIYRAARYTGLPDERQRAQGDAVAAFFDRFASSPETVARKIVRAVVRNRPVVPVTAGAWVPYVLSHLAPPLMRGIARIGQDTAFSGLGRSDR